MTALPATPLPALPAAAPTCDVASGPFVCTLPAGPHAVTADGRTQHYFERPPS